MIKIMSDHGHDIVLEIRVQIGLQMTLQREARCTYQLPL